MLGSTRAFICTFSLATSVKNQYFGDTRDLFKYDLALHILERTDLRRFTFVPMLTPEDETTDGVHVDLAKAKAGRDNQPLCDFLESCTREGRRDIRELDRFFAGTTNEILTYHPVLEKERRSQYFSDLPGDWLEDSVVVLDPDNGMEVPSGRGVKWLRYDELRHLYDDLGDRSVMLVFQFIPREKRSIFIPRIARAMIDRSGVEPPVHWVSDGHVVFYGLSRRGDVEDVLADYGRKYDLTTGSV